MFETANTAMEHIRAGKLLALAVSTASRNLNLPDVPALNEFLPGYEASGFQGVGAPINTPPEIIDELNREINAGLVDAKIKARLADWAFPPLVLSPAGFGKHLGDEIDKWAKVIRTANIKAE
jgi:tripartite-type tricarboxylate transporter receptor subunit TctC